MFNSIFTKARIHGSTIVSEILKKEKEIRINTVANYTFKQNWEAHWYHTMPK